MITVVGKLGCSNCEIVKQTLKKKSVDFNYVLLSELSKETQDLLLDKADEIGYTQMPLILKNDTLITIAEL